MWAGLDDGFFSDPRLIIVGNAGAGLVARAYSYSSRYMLDGRVPRQVLAEWAEGDVDLLRKLVEVGFIERIDDQWVRLPEFLQTNKSREWRLAEREKKRNAAKKRWDNDRERRRVADREPDDIDF